VAGKTFDLGKVPHKFDIPWEDHPNARADENAPERKD
jgi:hypothetical protein